MQLSNLNANNQNFEPVLKAVGEHDAYFVESLLIKDPSAFKKLYRLYSGAIMGQISRKVNDSEASCSILETVFLEAWNVLSIDHNKPFRPFTLLNQIANKHIKSYNQP